jgi:hypothetical protein
MDIAETIRKLQDEGVHRVSDAVGDLNAPWMAHRKRRSHKLKRSLVVAGFLFGLATIAALLVYAIVNESWRLEND